MDALNTLSAPGGSLKQPETGRRSFMWRIGAAMSMALASAVPGLSRPRVNAGAGSDADVDILSRKLGILEDEKAIRALHRTYETCLDNGAYDEAVDLFAEDGEVVFNGGVFVGKTGGVSRLYRECFRQGSTGKKIWPVPGFQPDAKPETIRVTADRRFATAQFPYSIQVGAPMASDSQLVNMARLHGEGIVKWWEGGRYEASYAKEGKDGAWRIRRLEYRPLSRTDYRPGRSHARPISVPLFAKTYPEDPAGPDRLVTPVPMRHEA
jgi:hypothetical protein